MLQVIGFVFIIALIYAAKAMALSKEKDDAVVQSASFCWMRPRSYEDVVASARETAEELTEASASLAPANATGTVRQVKPGRRVAA